MQDALIIIIAKMNKELQEYLDIFTFDRTDLRVE